MKNNKFKGHRNIQITRRERKRQAVREAILKTAIKLFNKKGFEDTTIQEITDRIDIAQSTFFNYFPTKEHLLFAIVKERLSPINEECKKIIGKNLSLKKKIQELFSMCFQVFLDNRPLAKSVLIENLQSRSNWEFGKDLFEGFKKNINCLLVEGQSCGEIRADVSVEKLSDVLESVFTFYIIDCLMCKRRAPMKKELFVRLDIIFEGIKKRHK